jgi:protein phosphatase PTC7
MQLQGTRQRQVMHSTQGDDTKPDAFARGLMVKALSEVAAVDSAGAPAVCPYELLEAAYERTVGNSVPCRVGCAARGIHNYHRLARRQSAEVGVRRRQRLCRAPRRQDRATIEPQRRSLNSPLQLSGAPGDSDDVTAARTGQVAARSGDVVVGATDGLLDNICDEQLERAVQVGTRLGFSAKNMADDVAGVAYEASRRTLMGKPDDITVVVAFVVHSDS